MYKYYLSIGSLALLLTGCNTSDIINPCKDLTVNAGADKTTQIEKEITLRGNAKSIGGTIIEQEWLDNDGSVLATSNILTYYPTKLGKHVLTFRASDDSGECTKEDSMVLTVINGNSSSTQNENRENSTTNNNSLSNNLVGDTSSNPSENNNNMTNNTIKYENLKTPYSWSNGDLGVKIASLKKKDNWITITAVYKNLSDNDIKFYIRSWSTYLLDENSNRWEFQEDSAELYRERRILPNRQIVTNMKFKSKDSNNGTAFDLIFDANRDEFDHRIYGIKAF